MKANKPLTDRAIQALKPTGQRRIVWDAIVPNLGLRITEAGAKSFVLVKRYPGSPHPSTRALGRYGAISLEDARQKAREWHQLIAQGIDPQAQKADTFAAIAEEYLSREGSKLRTADQRRATLDRLILPSLGARPISEIKRSEIIRLLDKIEDERGPRMADGALEIIRRVMNWHSSRSDSFRSPIVRGMARTEPSERARSRVLSDEELRALWQHATGAFGAYIRFTLLTATRRNEAARMTWAEANGDWIIPARRYKGNHDHLIPLSRAAKEIVEARPKLGEYVFTTNGRTPISGFSKFKSALDKASGVSDYRLHDLRRTARTLLSRAGISADVAERCLGHVIGGVRGVYDRHEFYREKVAAFEALAAQIERIVNPQENVVGLRR
jgi:integrase